MTTELPAPLQIREIEGSDFALVWPIFHAVVSAGDTYAYDPAMTFEEAYRADQTTLSASREPWPATSLSKPVMKPAFR